MFDGPYVLALAISCFAMCFLLASSCCVIAFMLLTLGNIESKDGV